MAYEMRISDWSSDVCSSDLLLSGDYPRSRPLALALLVTLISIACAPFLFPGSQPLNVAAKYCVFVILVASYDLLIGYSSEERRVGKEFVSTCQSLWPPYHYKHK